MKPASRPVYSGMLRVQQADVFRGKGGGGLQDFAHQYRTVFADTENRLSTFRTVKQPALVLASEFRPVPTTRHFAPDFRYPLYKSQPAPLWMTLTCPSSWPSISNPNLLNSSNTHSPAADWTFSSHLH